MQSQPAGMRTPPALGAQFLNAHPGRGGDYALFWAFPTVDLLLHGFDAVNLALDAKGEKILDTASLRATLTDLADPPPTFCVLAIAPATGPWQKPGVWHAGRVTSDKGKGLALTLIVDSRSIKTVALNSQYSWAEGLPARG